MSNAQPSHRPKGVMVKCPGTLRRTGEPEQLDHRENEQRRAEPDQAKPGLHDPEMAADSDQEQHRGEEHGVADVLVGGFAGVGAP